jgi:hypothetical protein
MAGTINRAAESDDPPSGVGEGDVVEVGGRTESGVRVRKVLDSGRFRVPSFIYEITSTREDAVPLRLVEPIPETVSTEVIGFHEQYGKDHWRIVDDRVEFARTVDPGETVHTVCGVQVEEVDRLTEMLESPLIEVGDDESATDVDDGTTSQGDGGDGHDQRRGEGESRDRDETRTGTDETVEGWNEFGAADVQEDVTLNLEGSTRDGDESTSGDESARGEQTATRTETGTRTGVLDTGATADSPATVSDPSSDADVPTEGVAGTLVEELRSDHLSEEQKRRFREELNLRLNESTSSFVDHLQRRIRREQASLESKLESLESTVDDLYGLKADAQELERVGTTTDRLESAVSALDEKKATIDQLETVRDALEDLDERTPTGQAVRDLERAIEALERAKADAQAVETVQQHVDELAEVKADSRTVATLRKDVEDLGESKADVETVRSVRSDLAALDDTAARQQTTRQLANRTDDLSGRLDDLTERIDDLASRSATETRADELERRIHWLEEETARADAVAAIESDLETEYVTETGIGETIDEGIDERVRKYGPFWAGVCVLSLGIGLVVSVPLVGTVIALLGGTIAVTWWKHRIAVDDEEPGEADDTI